MKKVIVTITGPTCSGKSTLAQELQRFGIEELVSVTTRPQREGEVDGVDYHFISRDLFHDMDHDGEIIQMVNLNGACYGTTRTEIERHEGNVCIVVEPAGVGQFRDWINARDMDIELLSIFVNNSLVNLVERFVRRFSADIAGNTSEYDDNVKLEHYCMRLRNLVEVEFKTWHNIAYYDWHILEYSHLNRRSEAMNIAKMVSKIAPRGQSGVE